MQTWDADDNRRVFTYTGHTCPLYALAWSPQSPTLASAGEDGQIHVWTDLTGQLLASSLAHTRAVKTLAWSPDGQLLASGGEDAILRLWQPALGHDLPSYTGHTRWIRSLTWSPDGRYLASASTHEVHIIMAPGTLN